MAHGHRSQSSHLEPLSNLSDRCYTLSIRGRYKHQHKRMKITMNKPLALATRLLSIGVLMFSAQAFAQRPAMEDAPAQTMPAPAELNRFEESDDSGHRPTATDMPAAQSAPAVESPQPQVQQQQTGDVLELRPGETLPVQVLNFPSRGMIMDKVQNELGQPLGITPAVGEPPITRWTYSDRVVYFEYSRVIHAVATR